MHKLSSELFTYEELFAAMRYAFQAGEKWEEFCVFNHLSPSGTSEEQYFKKTTDNIIHHLCG